MANNPFSKASLERAGFLGWVPFSELTAADVPRESGLYVVVRAAAERPSFLATSGAGWRKQTDPSVTEKRLDANWVHGATVLYIGKANAAKRRGLYARLRQYRRHGEGHNASHWGGRFIWQLKDHAELLVAWKTTQGADPAQIESQMLASFHERFGRLPFANLRE